MKVSIETQKLRPILQALNKIVPKNPTPLILGNLLIEAKDGITNFTAFNGSVSCCVSLESVTSVPGKITLPAELLTQIILKTHHHEITFKTQIDEQIEISSTEDSKINLSTMNADEFPELTTLNKDNSHFVIPTNILQAGFNQTIFSTSTEISKQILCGVNLQGEGDELKFASTDSFRLSVSRQELEEETQLQKINSCTIPRDTIALLLELIKQNSSSEIQVYIDENTICFQLTNCEIISSLVPGDYPNYQQLLPKNFSTQFIVSRLELIAVLEKAKIISKSKLITFDINKALNIKAEEQDLGNLEEKIDAEIIGKTVSINFNWQYLLEGLKTFDSHEIKFLLSDSSRPGIIKPLCPYEIDYLVMPIQKRG